MCMMADRAVWANDPSPTTRGSPSTTDYETSTYDAKGDVSQTRLRDGQLINQTFDNLNRVTFKDLPGSEPDVPTPTTTSASLCR